MTTVPDLGTPTSISQRFRRHIGAKPKLLAVCNIDAMGWSILRQWLIGLQEAGYEVHLACAPGEYWARLAAIGFHMHPVPMRRTFWPWAHIRALIELWKIIRHGDFVAVNTHSAVGGAIGRIAAWLAGSEILIYTVHGFYFHDNMPLIPRTSVMFTEWLLGRITRGFMFVSDEDRETAVRTGIVSRSAEYMTIFNGVDLHVFRPASSCCEAARKLRGETGIAPDVPVVGIVGRIVREKGHREFLEMAVAVTKSRKVAFLVVGDTLPSDRDPFGPIFRQSVEKAGLSDSFFFTGITDRVPEYLTIMDIFVLPSYREGFPRSIIEAMSVGLPVIATNIRGCREAVLDGKTGLIVPPADGKALGAAVEYLLSHPAEARAMGETGRARAVEVFDYEIVRRRFVEFIDKLVADKCPGSSGSRNEKTASGNS